MINTILTYLSDYDDYIYDRFIKRLFETGYQGKLVIFTKKGYFYEKVSSLKIKNLVIFTENKILRKKLQLHENCNSIYAKFPKNPRCSEHKNHKNP